MSRIEGKERCRWEGHNFKTLKEVQCLKKKKKKKKTKKKEKEEEEEEADICGGYP